jgi:hypothetical protein
MASGLHSQSPPPSRTPPPPLCFWSRLIASTTLPTPAPSCISLQLALLPSLGAAVLAEGGLRQSVVSLWRARSRLAEWVARGSGACGIPGRARSRPAEPAAWGGGACDMSMERVARSSEAEERAARDGWHAAVQGGGACGTHRRRELRESAGRRSERRETVGLCGGDSVLLRSCCHGRVAKG